MWRDLARKKKVKISWTWTQCGERVSGCGREYRGVNSNGKIQLKKKFLISSQSTSFLDLY